jgi:hypothetical protein
MGDEEEIPDFMKRAAWEDTDNASSTAQTCEHDGCNEQALAGHKLCRAHFDEENTPPVWP